MKKSGIFFIVFLLIFLQGFSQEKNPTGEKAIPFFLELTSSYNKESRDYCVIDTDGSTNSKLEWNADYLFKEGISGGIKFQNFEMFLSTQVCLPFECGKMYDSDWRTIGIKTNFSESNLFAGFGCDVAFQIKYNFRLSAPNSKLLISPIIQLSNSFIRFEAKNTIGWCGDTAHTHLEENLPWNSEYAKKVKKYGINFANNITSFFCGLEVSDWIDSIFVNAGLLISPYTYILSVDHHLNKEEGSYYQLVQKAYFKTWDFYAGAGYKINQKNMIALSGDFCFCPATNGDFYFGWFGTDNIIADETCSFAFSKFSLCFSWQIFL